MCIRDSILIASRTFEEHLEHIEYVLNKLYQGGLTVNWEKSSFLQKEIHFWGFIITPDGIQANPNKVESIMKFPEPTNVKQLQSFLGLCNFYRKFQRNYAQITAKLSTDVYKRQVQMKWHILHTYSH